MERGRPRPRAGGHRAQLPRTWASALLALALAAGGLHAESLTTLAGKSFAGKISVEPGAFVVTTVNQPVQRVPLADVRRVAFDRTTFTIKPAEWTGQSVGAQPAPGSFAQSNGVFTVSGAGTATAVDDGHYFVQQPVGETARLTAFVPPQASSRLMEKFKVAGLAVQGRFDGTGPAYLLLSGGGNSGITRSRSATGKERSKSFTTSARGVWLRLELCGQHVTALASDDGVTWRQVGTEVIAFPDTAHAGLLVAGVKKGVPVSVGFTHVELQHEAAPVAALPQLRLREGGVLAGRFISTDGSVVRWQALGREWQVSLVNVSRLLLDPRAETHFHRLRPERPGALLANGDFVDGELVAGAEGRVTISSVLFGLRSYSATGSALAVHLRDVVDAEVGFEIIATDGSRLRINQLEVRADGLAGRERSAGDFVLRLADLVELRRPQP